MSDTVTESLFDAITVLILAIVTVLQYKSVNVTVSPGDYVTAVLLDIVY